jgi:hypothetical protein
MKSIFKNWKTTFFGFTTILSGVAMIVKGQPAEGIAAILAGLGLTVSRDHDGGTNTQ